MKTTKEKWRIEGRKEQERESGREGGKKGRNKNPFKVYWSSQLRLMCLIMRF